MCSPECLDLKLMQEEVNKEQDPVEKERKQVQLEKMWMGETKEKVEEVLATVEN